MGEIGHRFIEANGLSIHIAEQGSGPLVLLLHGFPDTWYSWRYQLPALAAAGFHAVAPDLRGHGDTKGPDSPDDYTAFDFVGDLVGILDALGERQTFLVGHDWGAIHAWDMCLIRPERVKAIVALSVPFIVRSPSGSFLKSYRKALGEGFYMIRFQEKGVAEALFDKLGYVHVGKSVFLANPFCKNEDKPEEEDFLREAPEELPPWFTEDDLAHYVQSWNKSGFTTQLNPYRAIERSWKLKAAWADKGIPNTPAFFALGDKDLVYNFPGMKEYLHGGGFKALVPQLREPVVVEGAGHFVQNERHATVSDAIIKFFRGLVISE